MVTRHHHEGLPVLRMVFLYMHAIANTPAGPLGALVARLAQRYQPSAFFRRVGSRISPFRGLLSVHSRYGLHAR